MKTILRDNALSKKFLTLKNIILERLHAILTVSEQSAQHSQQKFDAIQDSLDSLLPSSQLIIENQVILLKSSIETVAAVQQSILKAEANLSGLNHSISGFSLESQRLHGSISQVLELVGESLRASEQCSHEMVQVREELLAFKQDFLQQNTTNYQLLGKIGEGVLKHACKLVADSSHFQDAEIGLMAYLYSFLPHRLAIDVGANRGDVSDRLLQAGFEVYAFEPFPPVLAKLRERFEDNPCFHALPYALGAVNESRDLHVVEEASGGNSWGDFTCYNTLSPYSTAEGLVFSQTTPVAVKALASLHESGELPCNVGLVKIDTEGFDLEVIKGMGDFRYPVVVAEFWDAALPLGQSGSMNRLKDMVPAMRQRGYLWSIIIYRIHRSPEVSFYCNSDYSFERSWGNVFFFQEHAVFGEALKWCQATMPPTFFAA
jgi:FkbM family methyltransferase